MSADSQPLCLSATVAGVQELPSVAPLHRLVLVGTLDDQGLKCGFPRTVHITVTGAQYPTIRSQRAGEEPMLAAEPRVEWVVGGAIKQCAEN